MGHGRRPTTDWKHEAGVRLTLSVNALTLGEKGGDSCQRRSGACSQYFPYLVANVVGVQVERGEPPRLLHRRQARSGHRPGAYTRPLFGSSKALSVGQGVHLCVV